MSWTRLTHVTLGTLFTLLGALGAVVERRLAYGVLAGLALVVGGLVTVLAGLFPRLRPGAAGWSVVALTALGGSVASLRSDTAGLQAQFDLYHYRGYPYPWLERHEWHATSLAIAPDRIEWVVGGAHLAADLLFWGSLGLLAVTGLRLVRPRRGAARPGNVTAAA